jgi:hypothetical protein
MRFVELSIVVAVLLATSQSTTAAQDSASAPAAETLTPEQRELVKQARLAAADQAQVAKNEQYKAYIGEVNDWNREYQDGQDRQTTAGIIVAVASLVVGSGCMIAGLAVDEESSAFGPLLGTGAAVLVIGGLTGAFMLPGAAGGDTRDGKVIGGDS